MTDRRFSHAELVEMFGGQIPIEAVNILMGAPDDEPLSKVRERITDLAVGWNTRALADRLEQREGWRGIESAPKDGTNILVWKPETSRQAQATEAWFCRPYEGASDAQGWWQTGRGMIPQGIPGTPTHWMPLPPAPEGT
jgi:hypothetical protein